MHPISVPMLLIELRSLWNIIDGPLEFELGVAEGSGLQAQDGEISLSISETKSHSENEDERFISNIL